MIAQVLSVLVEGIFFGLCLLIFEGKGERDSDEEIVNALVKSCALL